MNYIWVIETKRPKTWIWKPFKACCHSTKKEVTEIMNACKKQYVEESTTASTAFRVRKYERA